MSKQQHLVACTSGEWGSISLTMKNIPNDLHEQIIKKHGSYQNMQEYARDVNYDDSLMEEFLACEDVKPFEHFNDQED